MTKIIPITAISFIAAILIVGTITPALAGDTVTRPKCGGQDATVWAIGDTGYAYLWNNGWPTAIPLDPNPFGDGFTIEGTSGDDVIVGSPLGDLIKAGKGDDYACGLDGDDLLKGGFGNDWLFGGNDNDTLQGGHGNDYMFGESGNDLLKGGHGNDHMYGGANNDVMKGGHGNDHIDDTQGVNSISGGKGTDSCNPIADCEILYTD